MGGFSCPGTITPASTATTVAAPKPLITQPTPQHPLRLAEVFNLAGSQTLNNNSNNRGNSQAPSSPWKPWPSKGSTFRRCMCQGTSRFPPTLTATLPSAWRLDRRLCLSRRPKAFTSAWTSKSSRSSCRLRCCHSSGQLSLSSPIHSNSIRTRSCQLPPPREKTLANNKLLWRIPFSALLHKRAPPHLTGPTTEGKDYESLKKVIQKFSQYSPAGATLSETHCCPFLDFNYWEVYHHIFYAIRLKKWITKVFWSTFATYLLSALQMLRNEESNRLPIEAMHKCFEN